MDFKQLTQRLKNRLQKRFEQRRFWLMYVKDPLIFNDSKNNELRMFRTRLGRLYFLLTDEEAKQSLQADRFHIVNVDQIT